MKLPAMVLVLLLIAAAVLLGAAYLPTLRANAAEKPNPRVVQSCAKYKGDAMMDRVCDEIGIPRP